MYLIGNLCIVWGVAICCAALAFEVERRMLPPTLEEVWTDELLDPTSHPD